MLNWRVWTEGAQDWDSALETFLDYTVFQSHAWGEHKRQGGWQVMRLAIGTEAVAQILFRRYPMEVGLAWIPGGPVGNIRYWSETLCDAIRKLSGVRLLYVRLNAMREYQPADAERLASIGWSVPGSLLNSGTSLCYYPRQTESDRLAASSRNWRHNLRRSAKRCNAYLWEAPNVDEVLETYAAMEDHKGLAAQTSRRDVESLVAAFGDRCMLVRSDDEGGKILALRGALIHAKRGWDKFAATTPEGRKVYASHAAFWELMHQCALRGVEQYDMGGVDIVSNRGVYDFKKGTGAQDLRYLGEWDIASPAVLRIPAGRLIAWKIRR